MLRKSLILSVLTGMLTAFSYADETPEIIISCGASAGHSYFHESALVPKDDAGWSTDKLSDGSFFVQKTNDEYDLLFKDLIGMRAATDDGAIVAAFYQSNTALGLVVIYPQSGNVETYNFQNMGTANSEVSWTSSKVGTLIPKSAVFYAKCNG